MRDETRIDEQESKERHEAMDYAQHEKTWVLVTNLVKWSIIQLAFLVVGLYCIIFAGSPVAGVILITLLQSILSVVQMPEAGRQIIYGVVIVLMLLVYGRGQRVQG